jgi:hypothetical protein
MGDVMKYHPEEISQLTWQFLSGEMSAGEQQRFYQAMTEDEQLLEAVSEEVVRHHARQQLKAKMAAVAATAGAPSGKGNSRPIFWRAAAVVLLLLLPSLAWWYWHYSDSRSQSAYEWQQAADLNAGLEADSLSDRYWLQAIALYQQGNYEASARAFEQLLAHQDSQQHLYRFYLGISYLQQEPPRPEAAAAALREVAAQASPLQAQARWYLLQATLASGDTVAAMPLLREIAGDTTAFQHEAARKLMKELEVRATPY